MTASSPRPLAWLTLAASSSVVLVGAARWGAAAEIVVESVRPAESATGVTRYGLTREDLRRISKALPGVRRIVPVREMPARARHADRERALQLVGTVPEYRQLNKLSLEQGRFLVAKDVEHRNNVAVVDSQTARRLFPGQRAVGGNIRIGNHYFLIVGVLAAERTASTGDREAPAERCVLIPLTSMRSRYGDTLIQTRTGSVQIERYELSRIHVLPADGADGKQAAAVIESVLAGHHERRDDTVRLRGGSADR